MVLFRASFLTFARREERREKTEVVRHWWVQSNSWSLTMPNLEKGGHLSCKSLNLAERRVACLERWALMRPSKLVKPDYAGPWDGRASLKLSRCSPEFHRNLRIAEIYRIFAILIYFTLVLVDYYFSGNFQTFQEFYKFRLTISGNVLKKPPIVHKNS